jgi:hypothetical protein
MSEFIKADQEARINENTEEREEIAQYVKWAENRLEKVWGIKELSASEGVHLRNIVERLLPKIKEEKGLIEQRKMSVDNGTEVEQEAGELWLFEMYGIREKDFLSFAVEDETDGQEYTFRPGESQMARAKKMELLDMGHDVYVSEIIPQKTKMDIESARLRQGNN